MSQRLTRRSVAAGAVWSVPVIAVAAAAPAMAASGCPTVRLSIAPIGGPSAGTRQWRVEADFTDLMVGTTYEFRVTVQERNGATSSYTVKFTASATTYSQTDTITRHDNGNTAAVSYVLVAPSGTGCAG